MKVVTLASGSKGNCTLFQSEHAKILVDAGINLCEIEQKLIILGVDPKQINAILVTHEHSDHIKSVAYFSNKYNTKVFANPKIWNKMEEKIGVLKPELKISITSSTFYINELKIDTFPLSHDSVACNGYSFTENAIKLSIATDLGTFNESVVNSLRGSKLIILEANHDENLLLNNPAYPVFLKKRILSNKGHLSNTSSAELIARLVGEDLEQIVLAHLSEENNSPSLAYTFIKQYLQKNYGIIEGEHVFIDVSGQYEIGNIFEY